MVNRLKINGGKRSSVYKQMCLDTEHMVVNYLSGAGTLTL
jgi:hypothetical protein